MSANILLDIQISKESTMFAESNPNINLLHFHASYLNVKISQVLCVNFSSRGPETFLGIL
jgi:hypothetical protein